jgi:putative phosphotransacetylase
LEQPGQYAAAETVTVRTQHGEIPGVRILGPTRPMTQLEISLTDARRLGVLVPVRVSAPGGAGGVTLVGPKGESTLAEAAVAAMRHIHMNPTDAADFGVVDGDVVKVQVLSGRGLVFDNVVVRVNPEYSLEFHVDTDEANASGLRNGDQVMLIHPFRVPTGPCVGCPLARGGV